MKIPFKRKYAVILAGMLCIPMLGGCAQTQDGSKNAPDTETISDESAENRVAVSSLGEFSLKDVAGNAYTNEMLKEHKLTMINVFATWCTPCISEIPDLEKLHQEMKDQGVSVVGVVLDTVDEEGNIDEQAVEKAKLLAERTGASYPFLIPDAGALNGRLKGIEAIPETFFADSDGNIVGTEYVGSHSFKEWTTIVETQLASLKGDPS